MEIGLMFLDAFEDRPFCLANIEGRAVLTRYLVDNVGSVISRGRGLRSGECVAESGGGGEGDRNIVTV